MIPTESTPCLSLIVAQAQNRAIGRDNSLLWHISADLKRFKQLTAGHCVLMGRRTYLSLPRAPLPHRRNIVLTHGFLPPHPSTLLPTAAEPAPDTQLIVAHSVAEALRLMADDEEPFLIGGGTLYRDMMPWVKRMYVTWVYRNFEADTFFPIIDPSLFQQVSLSPRQTDPASGLEYAFAEYVRLTLPI